MAAGQIHYFDNGTSALSDDEKKDPILFHFTNDQDIIYKGLNVNLVLAFLVIEKTKANGKMSSVSDISKYNDTINLVLELQNSIFLLSAMRGWISSWLLTRKSMLEPRRTAMSMKGKQTLSMPAYLR
jgi:hypothetical protein